MKNETKILRYWECYSPDMAHQAQKKAQSEIARDCESRGWESYTLSVREFKDPDFSACGVVIATNNK